MRARDAVRKSTLKVNVLQVFTIDCSQIQFRMYRIVQRVGWTCTRRPYISSHCRGKDKIPRTMVSYSEQWRKKRAFETSLWLWEPLSWWKIVSATNQENKVKSVSIQINKEDGIHLQAHRGGRSLNGIGNELIFDELIRIFLSQLVSFTVDIGPLEPMGGVDRYFTRDFLDLFDFVHTSHCGSRCRSMCLTKDTHAHV